jgi:outer membrane protein assembly factor BamB
MKTRSARLIFLIACLSIELACSRSGPTKAEPSGDRSPKEPSATLAPDPRAQYESVGSVSETALDLESAAAYVALPGLYIAGPVAANNDMTLFAVARWKGKNGDVLVSGPDGGRAAHFELPWEPLDLAAVAGGLLVSGIGGDMLFLELRATEDGKGFELAEKWRQLGSPTVRVLSLPSDRIAVAREDGSVSSIEALTGRELWRVELGHYPTDIAYAVGLVIIGDLASVSAFAEESGTLAWKFEAAASTCHLAAGGGCVVLLDARGRLSFLRAKDGSVISEAPGPFDIAIRPLLDAGSAFAAVPGGGAAELDIKTGAQSRSWSWRGPATFLAVDEGRIISSAASRIILRARYTDSEPRDIELPGEAMGAFLPLGTRNAACALYCRGGIVVVGEREPVLDKVLRPSSEVAKAIEEALAGLGGAWTAAAPPPHYGVFVAGIPVYPDDGFAILRFVPESKGKRTLLASPDPGDVVIALFDEQGRKLTSSVDEVGDASRIEQWFEAGRTYWIAAGGRGGQAGEEYRLLLR